MLHVVRMLNEIYLPKCSVSFTNDIGRYINYLVSSQLKSGCDGKTKFRLYTEMKVSHVFQGGRTMGYFFRRKLGGFKCNHISQV